MFYNQIIKITLLISIAGHLLILGIPLTLFKSNPRPPKYITVHIEKPRPLPKIEKLGDEKILTSSESTPTKNGTTGVAPPLYSSEPTSSSEQAMLRYKDMVKQRVEQSCTYPEWAEEREYQGTVHLMFTISSSGQLGTTRILHSSGYPILDQGAIATIKTASPFPPIPEEINESSVNIEVSIVYLLKN